MRLSQRLIEDLKRHEGFRTRPYLCTEGRVTIGYGHNLEAHPDSILLFPEKGEELSERWMEAEQTVQEVKAGKLRGRALLDRLLTLGIEWSESDAELRLEQDIMGLESRLTEGCAAYRHLVNASAAAGAGRTLSATASDEAGVRADVLMNMTFNMGVKGVLKFRKMQQAILQDEYDTAAAEMLNSRWAAQVKGRAVELARQMRSGFREEVVAMKKQSRSSIRGMSMDSASVSQREKPVRNATVTANSGLFSAGLMRGEHGAAAGGEHSAMFAPSKRGNNMGGVPGLMAEYGVAP